MGIFSDDEALDMVILDELNEEEQRNPQEPQGGCLSLLLVAVGLPSLLALFHHFI